MVVVRVVLKLIWILFGVVKLLWVVVSFLLLSGVELNSGGLFVSVFFGKVRSVVVRRKGLCMLEFLEIGGGDGDVECF